MQIIDKIEINYFRSVYSITLNKCNDVNVIVGSNDAGKSNILKSLNLFFNNETDPHQGFDFLRDLCRSREEEARAAKGRMSVWIKVHFHNFLKWKSLPDSFWLKRSWNRYEDRPIDSFPEDIPSTTLYRFMNKLKFHYVPAVRGREIFSDLLADLHDTLLQDESLGLRQSSQDLVDDLHELTEGMSDKIRRRLGIDSTIEIPESLRDLFRALDFATKYGQFQIPLNMRGDGIQSRHLPFILDYISSKSNQYHIWGYEEPENSLELSKAFEMSRDFVDSFSKENQIFLTTHSPAFYDISSERSSRWYVENVEGEGEGSSYTNAVSINSVKDVDRTMGLLTVIAPRMREANEEVRKLREDIERMSDERQAANRPTIYVEGETDVRILSHAAQLYGFQENDLAIIGSDGASNITQFIKVMSRSKEDKRVLIGLFDGDATGRAEVAKFHNYHILDGTTFRVVSKPCNIFVGSLSVPDHLNEVSETFNGLGSTIPLCIEFMFSSELIARAQEEGVLSLIQRRSKLSNNELPLEVVVEDILRNRIPDEYLYLASKVADQSKTPFSEWVIEQDHDEFDVFETLFNEIRHSLN